MLFHRKLRGAEGPGVLHSVNDADCQAAWQIDLDRLIVKGVQNPVAQWLPPVVQLVLGKDFPLSSANKKKEVKTCLCFPVGFRANLSLLLIFSY